MKKTSLIAALLLVGVMPAMAQSEREQERRYVVDKDANFVEEVKFDSGNPKDYEIIRGESLTRDGFVPKSNRFVSMIDIRAYDHSHPGHGPDLNQGAGGKFIYCELSYASTLQQYTYTGYITHPVNVNNLKFVRTNAIFDVAVHRTSSNPAIPLPLSSSWYSWTRKHPLEFDLDKRMWEYDKTDMNEGAGGKYLYANYKTGYQPSAPPRNVVEDVMIIVGNSSSIQPPAPYIRVNVDLNEGAGGKWIFMCYKLAPINLNTGQVSLAAVSEKAANN
jgi:hypothetical protein